MDMTTDVMAQSTIDQTTGNVLVSQNPIVIKPDEVQSNIDRLKGLIQDSQDKIDAQQRAITDWTTELNNWLSLQQSATPFIK